MEQIDVLPNEVLLQTFDFYMKIYSSNADKRGIEAWQSLVHVCRRWRSLVFQSPRRLNLRLFCTPNTPARDTLDVWTALPLIIRGSMTLTPSTDNVIAALGQSNRVCEVQLWDLVDRQSEKVLAAMQVPFPELTDLRLSSHNTNTPIINVIPDSFLDGSAPRLQHLDLNGIPFPGLPKLLLTATHLVDLWLTHIHHSGYISPEAMVAPLCALSSLESLHLRFQYHQSRPGWESRNLPPPKRSILPALYKFCFKGDTEYLEELATRIDAPQLHFADITFFNQIDFDCPQLAQFIDCTPTLRAHEEARVVFDDRTASVKFRYWRIQPGVDDLLINISCREPDWQLSSVAQVCNSSFPPLSSVKDLYIEHQYSELVWKNDAIENALWLELLLPFIAVKNLYLSKEFAPGIAAALQDLIGDRIAEVLPNLRKIFVEGLGPWGPFQEDIGQFAAARRHSGHHPIAISVWDNDSDMELM